jgi:hypothetical protein
MPFEPSWRPKFQQAHLTPRACPAAPAAERRWSTRRLVMRAALAAILLLGLAGPSEATKCPATIHIHSGQCWLICYFVGQEPDGTCDYDYCTPTGCN